MKMLAVLVVLLSAVGVAFIRYHSIETYIKLNPVQMSNTLSLSILVKDIGHKVVDLTAPGDLLAIGEFKQILSNPHNYYSEAISFLENESNTTQSKQIVCYSMQSLDDESFFQFLNECAQLYSK